MKKLLLLPIFCFSIATQAQTVLNGGFESWTTIPYEDPNSWYLQYAALVWKGKKIIYINAVSTSEPETFVAEMVNGNYDYSKQTYDWKSYASVVCDGGTAWGVIYEPQTGKFSNLAVNGIA